MTIRILHIVSFLSLLAVNAWSQSNDSIYYHWNLGISAGDILHELFNGENTNEAYPAFVLEYSGQKYSAQVGFRPDYNMTDTQHEGFLDSDVTEALSLSGNLAVTRHIFISKHWLIKAGLQCTGGWSKEDINEDSGFDRVTTRRLQWNVGLGPVIDFRYFVHPRISLGMESSLIYSVSRSELQQIFTNFPDFDNTKDTVEGSSLEVLAPSTIYLRFHF